MESNIELKLKFINNHFHEYLTIENKATLAKLQQRVKNGKNSHEYEQLTEQNYYQSPHQQVEALQRKIKNNFKYKVSDYQAFLILNKKEDVSQEFPQLIKILKISEKPKKLTTDSYHQKKIQNVKLLDMSVYELCKFSVLFLEEKGKCKELMKQKQLTVLVKLISEQYNVNSYHNFTHSVSMLLLFRQIQNKLKINKDFTDLQLFVSEIAALAHDLGHKGLNALWEIKMKSSLATIYNAQSLLQKMHIAKFFRILKQHKQLDFFLAIKDTKLRESCKKLFIRLILSTDMSKHFGNVKSIQNKWIQNHQTLMKNHKQEVLQLLFHSADIGNPCMQFDEYINWSILLTFQFNYQAIKQEKAGIDVSPGFRYAGLQNFYNGQMGFIKTFCLPLWKTIALIYPSANLFLDKIHQNFRQIQNKLEDTNNQNTVK